MIQGERIEEAGFEIIRIAVDQRFHLLGVSGFGIVVVFLLVARDVGVNVALLMVSRFRGELFRFLQLRFVLFLVAAATVECAGQSPMTHRAIGIEAHRLFKGA